MWGKEASEGFLRGKDVTREVRATETACGCLSGQPNSRKVMPKVSRQNRGKRMPGRFGSTLLRTGMP